MRTQPPAHIQFAIYPGMDLSHYLAERERWDGMQWKLHREYTASGCVSYVRPSYALTTVITGDNFGLCLRHPKCGSTKYIGLKGASTDRCLVFRLILL